MNCEGKFIDTLGRQQQSVNRSLIGSTKHSGNSEKGIYPFFRSITCKEFLSFLWRMELNLFVLQRLNLYQQLVFDGGYSVC